MLTFAIILIVLWLAGLLLFKAVGVVIHLALIAGLVLLVLHFVRGRRSS